MSSGSEVLCGEDAGGFYLDRPPVEPKRDLGIHSQDLRMFSKTVQAASYRLLPQKKSYNIRETVTRDPH